MGYSTEDTVFGIIGLAGGICLTCSLIPQIHHIQSRRSSGDISYTYQLMFTIGLAMFVGYFWYYSLWPLFCTNSCSVFLSMYIMCLKIYLEQFAADRKQPGDGDDGDDVVPQDYTPGTALLPADQLAGQNARTHSEGPPVEDHPDA